MLRGSGHSVRDRTAEFQGIVERLRKAQGPSAPVSTSAVPPQRVHAEFSGRAQKMTLAIFQLAARISQLTRLAKQTSMFQDNSEEINHLTAIVKRDLQGLNSELQELQSLTGRNGGSQQSTNHSTRVVDNLRVQLKNTTDNFKSVLEVRKDALQATQDRRQLFSSAAPDAGQSHQASFFDDAPSATGSSMQQQSQMVAAAPQADAYLQSRDVALREINSTIQELGGIFTQVAQMVQEQGEIALRIDENVDNVVTNIDGAQTHLLKYLNTISSNRWLALKVFGILLVFLVLFIFIS